MFGFCWHKFEDKETQMTKNVYFGACPGIRIKQICKKCGKVNYVSLNIAMPNKYLYTEHLWKIN